MLMVFFFILTTDTAMQKNEKDKTK